METILNLPIQNEILLSMNISKAEFASDIKVWAAISMFYFGKISLAHAANLADMHRFDFEKLLSKYKLPVSLLDENDAKKEIDLIDKI